MEVHLRTALIAWIAADPTLARELNAITEEAPSRASMPWLAIVSSSSTDWGCKTNDGREVRIALELQCRGDRPDDAGSLVTALERRIATLPRDQDGFTLVTTQFLRARAEQRGASSRAILLEYRFRLLAE